MEISLVALSFSLPPGWQCWGLRKRNVYGKRPDQHRFQRRKHRAVGGIAVNVLFAGIAPETAGLYQVNVTIPQGVAKGGVNVVITMPNRQTIRR